MRLNQRQYKMAKFSLWGRPNECGEDDGDEELIEEDDEMSENDTEDSDDSDADDDDDADDDGDDDDDDNDDDDDTDDEGDDDDDDDDSSEEATSTNLFKNLFTCILNNNLIKFRKYLDDAMSNMGDSFEINLSEQDEPGRRHKTLLEFCLVALTEECHHRRLPFVRTLIEYGVSLDEVDLKYYSDPKRFFLGQYFSRKATKLSTVKYFVEVLGVNINMDIISTGDPFTFLACKLVLPISGNNMRNYIPPVPIDDETKAKMVEREKLACERYYRMYTTPHSVIQSRLESVAVHEKSIRNIIKSDNVTLSHAHGLMQHFENFVTQSYLNKKAHIWSYLLNDAGMYDDQMLDIMIYYCIPVSLRELLIRGNSIGVTYEPWQITCQLLCIHDPIFCQKIYWYMPMGAGQHTEDNVHFLFDRDQMGINPLDCFNTLQCQRLLSKLLNSNVDSTCLFKLTKYMLDDLHLLPILSTTTNDDNNNTNSIFVKFQFNGNEALQNVALNCIFCDARGDRVYYDRFLYFIDHCKWITNDQFLMKLIDRMPYGTLLTAEEVNKRAMELVEMIIISYQQQGKSVQPGSYVLHDLMKHHRLTKLALERLLTAKNEQGESLGFDGLIKNSREQTIIMNINSWQYDGCFTIEHEDMGIPILSSDPTIVLQTLREIHQQVDELVKYLIEDIGIDINAVDNTGKTAIMYVLGCSRHQQHRQPCRQFSLPIFTNNDLDYEYDPNYDKNILSQLVVLRILYKYGGRLDICDNEGKKNAVEHYPWIKKMFVGSRATVCKPLPYGGCEEEWKEQDERFFGMCMSLDWLNLPIAEDDSIDMPVPDGKIVKTRARKRQHCD